jgi:hypothetical protein
LVANGPGGGGECKRNFLTGVIGANVLPRVPLILQDRPAMRDNRTMTPGDDLDRIKQTLDYVATLQRSHDEQIGKLVEKTDRLAEHSALHEKRMAVLTERTIRAMDAIARLARIADIHENRIDDLENPPQ